MFIIDLHYKVELERVDQFLIPHIEFLDKYFASGNFIVSGRKIPRTGGVIIADNITLEDLNKIIAEDPFYINDIAEYKITEFIPTKTSTTNF